MDEFEKQVKAAVKAMPLAFLPRTRLSALQIQLEQEKNRLNHESGKNQIETRVNDFWKAFIGNDKVKEVLGKSASIILDDPLMQEAVRECWDKLYYPLPEQCAEYIEHNYLSVNAHAEIQNKIKKLRGMPQTELSNLLAERERLETERKHIISEIEMLKGTNNDELVEQLKKENEETDRFNQQVGQLKNNLVQQEKTYQRFQNDVHQLQDQISHNNPLFRKSQRAGEIEKVIIRLTEELLKQKIIEGGLVATQINREIAMMNVLIAYALNHLGK